MANINNYPYTNMVYQNVDWLADEVEEAKAMSERAEQTAQGMDSRVSTLETDMNDVYNQLASHESTINQNSTEISTLRDSLSNVAGEVKDINDAQLPAVRSTAVRAEEKADALQTSKVDKTNTGYRVYGTNSSGEQSTYAIDVTNELKPDSVVTRAANGIIKTPAPVINNDAANKQYVDEAVSSKVDKAGVPNILYGTNHASREVGITYSQGANVNTIVQRTEDGTIRTNPPVNIFDATNKRYVDELKWTTVLDKTLAAPTESNVINYTDFTSIENCKELKITTIIDNGATNPTLYDSENLEVSINGGFSFSVNGAVPNASSTVEATQEFTTMYTWDWSSFGFGEQQAQILTKRKFTRESLLAANVSITSILSSDTYEVTSVNESATSADAPGYKGYKVTFQKTGDPNTLRYGVLATQVESAAPDLQVGMLCICSFDAGGDISDLSSGEWTYTDTVAIHKIATGNLDMKFINADMAETETSGSGNRDAINNGTVIPESNIKHYALHPADATINTIQIHLSNGVFREGTRIIVRCKGIV